MADNYKILGQKQDTVINPAGTGFEHVWEITYQVTDGPSKGTVATLTVPEDDHNPDYVKQAIETKISALDGVAGL